MLIMLMKWHEVSCKKGKAYEREDLHNQNIICKYYNKRIVEIYRFFSATLLAFLSNPLPIGIPDARNVHGAIALVNSRSQDFFVWLLTHITWALFQ